MSSNVRRPNKELPPVPGQLRTQLPDASTKAPPPPAPRAKSRKPSITRITASVIPEVPPEVLDRRDNLLTQIRGVGGKIAGNLERISSRDRSSTTVPRKKEGIGLSLPGRSLSSLISSRTFKPETIKAPKPVHDPYMADLSREGKRVSRAPDMSGYLFVKKLKKGLGAKFETFRRRFCVIKDSSIYYFKSEGAEVLGVIELTDSSVRDNDSFIEVVLGDNLAYYLIPDPELTREKWINAITKVCRLSRDERQSSREEVSLPKVKIVSTTMDPLEKEANLAHREPEQAGWMKKKKRRAAITENVRKRPWQNRFCVLKSGKLYYFREMFGEFLGVISLPGCTVKSQDGQYIEIILPDASAAYAFTCDEENDVRVWSRHVLGVKGVIRGEEEEKAQGPTLRQRGVSWYHDITATLHGNKHGRDLAGAVPSAGPSRRRPPPSSLGTTERLDEGGSRVSVSNIDATNARDRVAATLARRLE